MAGEYTVPQGYHDGSGKVSIDATEQAKLIATNIREGVTILGVEGAMSGSEDMKPQSKEVTPSKKLRRSCPMKSTTAYLRLQLRHPICRNRQLLPEGRLLQSDKEVLSNGCE